MTWQLLAHRSELAKPGDFLLLSGAEGQVLGYNLNGTMLVSDNACLHRGARIFNQAHGNAPLKCPYHGFEGMAIQDQKYLTQWVGDWIFFGPGDKNLSEEISSLGQSLSEISMRITRRHAFDVMPMPCRHGVAIENALEDLHVGSVHPDTFGKLDLRLQKAVAYGKNSVAYYKIGNERIVGSLAAMSKSFVDVEPDAYIHIFLWPYTCLSSVGGFTYSLQHYMPSVGFTSLHTRLYQGRTRDGAPHLGYFFDEAADFNRRVFRQDSEICARVVGDGTYLAPSEERIMWYREAGGSFHVKQP